MKVCSNQFMGGVLSFKSIGGSGFVPTYGRHGGRPSTHKKAADLAA